MELKYFNFPGRAEPIRILLSAAKLDWKNTSFGFADWPSIKPTTPLGSVPTLEIDGTVFCQSASLQRYAAKLVGLYPMNDPFKALIVDESLDTINELMEYFPWKGTKEELKISRPAFQKNRMTRVFGHIEKRIQQFGGSSKDSVCGLPSVADINLLMTVQFFTSGQFCEYIEPNFFKDYPGILACCEKTSNFEIVKAYNASKQYE